MRQKIETLIVSDLHLGSGVSRAAALRQVLRQYDYRRLILNGDIFDHSRFQRLRRGDWRLLSEIRQRAQNTPQGEVVWIAGNHDPWLRPLAALTGARVCKEYAWEENGRRCLALHGHQFDRFMKDNAGLSAVATVFYALAQRFDTADYRCSRWLKRRCKTWLRNSELVAEQALDYAARRQADVVFCGHTHQAMQREQNGRRYLNSGCWTDHYSYIITRPGESAWLSLMEENTQPAAPVITLPAPASAGNPMIWDMPA